MKPIYLESDEEITSIIDKLKGTKEKKVAIVLPKNSALLQSLISLRLLVKETKKHQKEVVLITDSKIGQRLAAQVGLVTHTSLEGVSAAIEAAVPTAAVKPNVPAVPPVTLPGGIRVNQYLGEREAEEQPLAAPDSAGAEVVPELSAGTLPIAGAVSESDETATNDSDQEAEPAAPKTAEPESETREKPEPVADQLPPIIPRTISVDPVEQREFHIPWRALVVGLALILISGSLVVLFLPKATVKLTVMAKAISQSIELSALSAGEGQDGTIAASALTTTKELAVTITATGKKDIGTKAAGKVKITNKYKDTNSAGKDQSFAAGTKVTDSKTQKTFTLNNAVTVGKLTYNPNNGAPIYQSQVAAVTATEPGESSNLGASSFTIAGALANTTVETDDGAFTGGQTKTVTVLTQDDINKAITQAKTQANQAATAEIKTQAGSKTILDGASWQTVAKQSVDQVVGAAVSTATATLTIETGAIVFDESLAIAKLDLALRQDLTAEQDLARPEDKQPSIIVKSLASDKKSLILTVSGDAFVVPKLAKNDIARALARQSVSRAEEILKTTYKTTEAEIIITPSWWPKRLPFLSQAIMVEYGFNAVSGS